VRKIAENSDALQRTLIFDAMRLIDGIEPSDDPVLKVAPGPIRCRIQDAPGLPDRRERSATEPVATFRSFRRAI
jgi:hypothetical protein